LRARQAFPEASESGDNRFMHAAALVGPVSPRLREEIRKRREGNLPPP